MRRVLLSLVALGGLSLLAAPASAADHSPFQLLGTPAVTTGVDSTTSAAPVQTVAYRPYYGGGYNRGYYNRGYYNGGYRPYGSYYRGGYGNGYGYNRGYYGGGYGRGYGGYPGYYNRGGIGIGFGFY
jgi:hypothetical protein